MWARGGGGPSVAPSSMNGWTTEVAWLDIGCTGGRYFLSCQVPQPVPSPSAPRFRSTAEEIRLHGSSKSAFEVVLEGQVPSYQNYTASVDHTRLIHRLLLKDARIRVPWFLGGQTCPNAPDVPMPEITSLAYIRAPQKRNVPSSHLPPHPAIYLYTRPSSKETHLIDARRSLLWNVSSRLTTSSTSAEF